MGFLSEKASWWTFSAAVLTAGLAWMALWSNPAEKPMAGVTAPQQGFFAPAFSLLDVNGEPKTMDEFTGQPVLVNFWASWCGPCQAEMAAIERVYQEYRDEGFVVLAVNTTYQDSRDAALSFSKARGLTFPILFDETGETASEYQIRALPTSFFVAADGRIRSVVIGGPMTEALLRSQVVEMLRDTR